MHSLTRDQLFDTYKLRSKGYFARLVAFRIALLDILKQENLEIEFSEDRVKDAQSFAEKALSKEYDDPFSQITDQIGFRVVCRYPSTAENVEELVRKHFLVDDKNSEDKQLSYQADQFWYRSRHVIVVGSKNGNAIPSDDTVIEVQIRTLLEHAWASVQRETVYKNVGNLNRTLQRRSARISAVLELADNELEEFATAARNYLSTVEKEESIFSKSVELSGAVLKRYLEELVFLDSFFGNSIHPTIRKTTDNVVGNARTLAVLSVVGVHTTESLSEYLGEIVDADFKFLEDVLRNSEVHISLSSISDQLALRTMLFRRMPSMHIYQRAMLESGFSRPWKFGIDKTLKDNDEMPPKLHSDVQRFRDSNDF